MAASPIKIPNVADKDKTPLVKELLTAIDAQQTRMKQLEKYAAKTQKIEITDPARQNIYNVIKSKRSFAQMPDEMLRRLVKNMKVLRIKKGKIVLTQGEPSSFVYLMLRGCVSVLVDGKLVYAFRRIGDIFGEMSFLNQTVCSATIRAETDLELMVISKKSLKYIGNEDFYLWLCRILSDKLNRTSKQLSGSSDQSKPTPEAEKTKEKPEEISKDNGSEASKVESVLETEQPEEAFFEKEDEEELFEEKAINNDMLTDPDDFFAPE